jgi:hypothetical protein
MGEKTRNRWRATKVCHFDQLAQVRMKAKGSRNGGVPKTPIPDGAEVVESAALGKPVLRDPKTNDFGKAKVIAERQ